MKKTALGMMLIGVILLAWLTPMAKTAQATDAAKDSPVYVERIAGHHYHSDAVCPVANELNFPMLKIPRAELPIFYAALRPCMICAIEEREAYYIEASSRLSEEEILRQIRDDEICRKLKDSFSFTFADWYYLYPETYAIPNSNDLSKEEAKRIASDALERQYGVDGDECYQLRSTITCFPNIFHNGVYDLKLYHVQWIDLSHPFFYGVKVITTTGEVISVERVENIRYDGNKP